MTLKSTLVCDRCGTEEKLGEHRKLVRVEADENDSGELDRFDLCTPCTNALEVWLGISAGTPSPARTMPQVQS